MMFRKPQLLNRARSEEHTSELQSRLHLVCRLLLEKKKNRTRGPRSRRAPIQMSRASTRRVLTSGRAAPAPARPQRASHRDGLARPESAAARMAPHAGGTGLGGPREPAPEGSVDPAAAGALHGSRAAAQLDRHAGVLAGLLPQTAPEPALALLFFFFMQPPPPEFFPFPLQQVLRL